MTYINLVGVDNFLNHLQRIIEHDQYTCESCEIETLDVLCIVQEVEQNATDERETQSEDLLRDLESNPLVHESLQELEIN